MQTGCTDHPGEITMRYMLIIANDPEIHPQPGGPGWDDLMAGYAAFSEQLASFGKPFAGDPLGPPDSATTVRVRNGETVTTDGPFAETKEWMSGYYTIEADNLDQALQCAAMVPSAKFGAVEVRPLVDM
jgi:hypothetical protein